MEIIINKETGIFCDRYVLEGCLSNPEYYVKVEDITEEEKKEVKKFMSKLTRTYNRVLKRIDDRQKYDTGRAEFFREGYFDPHDNRLPWIRCGVGCSGKGMSSGNYCARGLRRINGELLISRVYVSAIYGSSEQNDIINEGYNSSWTKRYRMPMEFFSIAELTPMSDDIIEKFEKVLNDYVDKYIKFYDQIMQSQIGNSRYKLVRM